LESSFIHQHLTTLAADRLLHALASAPRSPKLVVFISCFSRQPATVLSRCAPFVIRTDRSVGDEERTAFVKHFYAHLFATRSVTGSFAHATRMLRTEGLSAEAFTLHRPELTARFESAASPFERRSRMVAAAVRRGISPSGDCRAPST
jgi:hypothetical protein